jgi:hypothetical protein
MLRLTRWLPSAAAAAAVALGGPARAQTPDDPPPVPAAELPPVEVIAPAQGQQSAPPTSGSTGSGTSAAGPASTAPNPGPAAGGGGDSDIRKKVPPVPRPPARSGYFGLLPTGCGYYSAYDCLTGTARKEAPKFPFPPFLLSTQPFFEADYRYADDPKYTPDFWERMKRIRVGDDWLLATGGQTWFRYENQYNGASRLSARDNVEGLYRVRPYVDVWYQDKFRFFVEGMFADVVWNDLPPFANEVDRADFQNLFVEAKLGTVKDKPVYARVGRQEVQLGSQRLLGTPDWANIRTTFDGARVFRVGDKWDVDLFWLRPRVITNINGPNSGDNNQNFAGAWATYKPKKGTTRDFYFLVLDNTNNVTQQGIAKAPFTNYTLGSRWAGDRDNAFLYDFEGGVQLGRRGREDIVAGFATAGVGYNFKDTPWKPVVWAYYDYASGDHRPNSGTYNTFNQLFPFGHYYFGYVDAIGRQNIHDLNFVLWTYPSKWVTQIIQQHNFWLDSRTDALYNAFGNAYRRDATGRAGSHVGTELDYLVNFHLTKRADFFVGYSYLWGGEFLKNTSGPNAAKDSSLAYFSYSYRW